MTFDNSNPIWVPFIERKEGVKYECETCLDYGGLLAPNTCDDEYLPFFFKKRRTVKYHNCFKELAMSLFRYKDT